MAPNGQPWPLQSGYVTRYPKLNTSGLSTVTVDNSQNDSNVFVKLTSLSGEKSFPVRTFFIRAREKFTLKSVTSGLYDVRYLDLTTQHLWRTEEFDLTEVHEAGETNFSNMILTLYKVPYGNMQIYDLSEEGF